MASLSSQLEGAPSTCTISSDQAIVRHECTLHLLTDLRSGDAQRLGKSTISQHDSIANPHHTIYTHTRTHKHNISHQTLQISRSACPPRAVNISISKSRKRAAESTVLQSGAPLEKHLGSNISQTSSGLDEFQHPRAATWPSRHAFPLLRIVEVPLLFISSLDCTGEQRAACWTALPLV